MNIDHKMPEAYLKHKVFDDLKYMMEFYDSLSCSCFSFVASGTKGIVNYYCPLNQNSPIATPWM